MYVAVSSQLFQILQTLKDLDIDDQKKKSSQNILGDELDKLKNQIGVAAIPKTSIQNSTQIVDIAEINSAIEKIKELLPIFGYCFGVTKNEYLQITQLWYALENIKRTNPEEYEGNEETEETLMDSNTHAPVFGTYAVYLTPKVNAKQAEELISPQVKNVIRRDEYEAIEFVNEENHSKTEPVKTKEKRSGDEQVAMIQANKRQKQNDPIATEEKTISKHKISFLLNSESKDPSKEQSSEQQLLRRS